MKALREVGRFLWRGLVPPEHPVWPPFRGLLGPFWPLGPPLPVCGLPAQAHPQRLGHAAPVAARSPVPQFAAWAFAHSRRPGPAPSAPPFLLFPLPLKAANRREPLCHSRPIASGRGGADWSQAQGLPVGGARTSGTDGD